MSRAKKEKYLLYFVLLIVLIAAASFQHFVSNGKVDRCLDAETQYMRVIPLFQTRLILKIIFMSRVQTSIDFRIGNKMLKTRRRNQDNHQNEIKEIFLFLRAAHASLHFG